MNEKNNSIKPSMAKEKKNIQAMKERVGSKLDRYFNAASLSGKASKTITAPKTACLSTITIKALEEGDIKKHFSNALGVFLKQKTANKRKKGDKEMEKFGNAYLIREGGSLRITASRWDAIFSETIARANAQ